MPYLMETPSNRHRTRGRSPPRKYDSYTFPQRNEQQAQRTSEELAQLRSRIFSNDPLSSTSNSTDTDFTPHDEPEVLNKALNNSNQIVSNYWKIPERNYSYLTAVSSHNDKPFLAISNSAQDSNLLIYELNPHRKLLSHHQSITLPNITSLQWLDSVTPTERSETADRDDINFLLSGHTTGHVHLSIIPEPENDVFHSAEIIKRFNHNKHIDLDFTGTMSGAAITEMQISPKRWKSCNMNSLLTLHRSNVFMWDTSRSRAPILKYKSVGIKNFNPSPCNDGLLGICGEFGIALFDLRAQDGSPNFYVPTSKNSGVANNIKWSPFDSNVLASSYEDGVVKLWDVRMTRNSFARLEGHRDTITSIEWSESATNDLFTSSKDGNIIHWDLSDVSNHYSTIEEEVRCGLNVGLESVNLVAHRNGKIELATARDLVGTRQCGTVVPASSEGIVDLVNIGDGQVLSIDGGSFLGLHNKTMKEPLQTEKMMIEILNSMNKNSGLVEDTSSLESLTMPKTPRTQDSGFFSGEYKSNDTYINSPTSSQPDQRVSSTSTTSETLVGSPAFKRHSYFQTLPLPYHHEQEDKPLPPVMEEVKAKPAKSHKKSYSLFSTKDTHRRTLSKFRDFSGATLTNKMDDDLLTDLSIEDGFTFNPVLPLAVPKVRPAYY